MSATRRPLGGLPAAYTAGGAGRGVPDAAAAGWRAADPLRYCVATTVALLAWLLGPPVVVAVMAGLGLAAYGRAVRRGLAESRCVLRRPRLVLAYLAIACAAGTAAAVWALWHRLRYM